MEWRAGGTGIAFEGNAEMPKSERQSNPKTIPLECPPRLLVQYRKAGFRPANGHALARLRSTPQSES